MPAAQRGQLGVALGPGRSAASRASRRSGERELEVRRAPPAPPARRPGPPRPRGPGVPAGLGARRGPRAPGRRPGRGRRRGRRGPGPAPRRCGRRGGPPSRSARPSLAGSSSRSRAAVSGSGVARRPAPRTRPLEPLLELGEGRPVGLQRLAGRGRSSGPAARPRRGGAGLGAELAELLGDRRHPGVGLVELVERACTSRDASCAAPRRATGARSGPGRSGDRPRPAGLRPRRPRPAPRAGSARGRAAGGVVARRARRRRAVTAMRPGRRTPPTRGGCQVARRRRRRRAAGTRAGRRASGASTRSSAARAPAGSDRAVGVRRVGGAADQQADPAGVVGLEQAEPPRPPPGPATATASAAAPSAAATAVSYPGVDGEQRGDRAEHAGEPVARGEQRAGAVLAGSPSSSASRRATSAARSRSASRSSSRSSASRSSAAARRSAASSCVGVEVLLARVEPGDLGLQAR